mmetsp:Transcript_36935/g.102595  ORF Transcript_36935/g.102595 Transcript_36935/m.102595 type:complete len:207 (+) Transcript_36935:42-662(+)
MPVPNNAPINVPDGVERLGVAGLLQALQNMQRKVGQDACFAMLRKWGAEGRITPQRKLIVAEDVEVAISQLLGTVQDVPEKLQTKDDLKRSGPSKETSKPTIKRHKSEGSVAVVETPPKEKAEAEAKKNGVAGDSWSSGFAYRTSTRQLRRRHTGLGGQREVQTCYCFAQWHGHEGNNIRPAAGHCAGCAWKSWNQRRLETQWLRR